jgi:hypothetical protein
MDPNIPNDLVFGVNEVYSINIVMSTGTGDAQESKQFKTTVLQRDVEKSYNLKLKASRMNTLNLIPILSSNFF